jgi:Transposase IS66 family
MRASNGSMTRAARPERSSKRRVGRMRGASSDIARINNAPIAIEAVKRIDALFAIEREINGLTPHERLAVRAERSRSFVLELEAWLREQRAKLSGQSETTKAIAYSLTRWAALTRFLDACFGNRSQIAVIAFGSSTVRLESSIRGTVFRFSVGAFNRKVRNPTQGLRICKTTRKRGRRCGSPLAPYACLRLNDLVASR